MKRHVALVGFMASGKSTIGRKLARKLGWAFVDTDALVVRSHGPIPAIFENEGEAAFRRYEHAAIAGVLEGAEPCIVALGGGAVTVAENRSLLAERAVRVFIKISPEQMLARLRRSRVVRPMLGARADALEDQGAIPAADARIRKRRSRDRGHAPEGRSGRRRDRRLAARTEARRRSRRIVMPEPSLNDDLGYPIVVGENVRAQLAGFVRERAGARDRSCDANRRVARSRRMSQSRRRHAPGAWLRAGRAA